MAIAIKDMHVRGAGLIGAAAGYGMYLAARQALAEAEETGADVAKFQSFLGNAADELISTRPTAVNLEHAVKRQILAINGIFRSAGTKRTSA
jgi:methylthioribose-1-phosphate isomerase